MSVLYVSDLDGTLLNGKREITEKTARLLNNFIDNGGLFTVATARMPYTCDYRLEKIDLKYPAILMNGVLLYDFQKKSCLHSINIASSLTEVVLDCLKKHRCGAYLYTYQNGGLNLYFEDSALNFEGQYYNKQARKGCQFAGLAASFASVELQNAIYIAALGEPEKLKKARKEIEQLDGISCAGYVNIYNGGYCLEIYSGEANKAIRAKELQKNLRAEHLVSFGDNYNDMKLMKISDRSYAPANALDEVKGIADHVIGSNDEDGVAEFIIKDCNE